MAHFTIQRILPLVVGALVLSACGGSTGSTSPTTGANVAPTLAATSVGSAPAATLVSEATAPAATVAADATSAPAGAAKVALKEVAQGFQEPLYLTNAGDDSGRMFVIEKAGTVRMIRDGQRVEAPFLDITSVVGSDSSEQGLLGLAFHPDYRNNGFLFVDYTDKNGNTVIARYKVSDQADVADPNSAKVLLQIEQPAANHNGGQVAFGPDGFLYIGMGDGGRAGDPWGNGQNTQALLGKLLRIDVNSGDPYAIPSTNPFADGTNGKAEVWAYGLRNPWRFSFDRADGTLFIADVGQNKFEEINAQPANQPGLNYGWNTTEGQECYSSTNCDQTDLVAPVAVYAHGPGCSVTGGYVYRGAAFPQLTGQYFFGDYCSGQVWSLTHTNETWQQNELLQTGMQISSFGEDQQGEIYVTDIGKGTVYQVTAE